MSTVSKAFILGAGLGTRLRPLTDQLPKPLVPVWNAPLITYAFDHLIHEVNAAEFLVNTHHAALRYHEVFPDSCYRGKPIEFRFEETLLDTAGGLDNIRNWLPEDEIFIVYNGDILTDLPIEKAVGQHRETGDLVTLILRSNPGNAAWDAETLRITDMRNALGTNATQPIQFTGIYLVSPAFLAYVEPGKIESVVFPFLKAIQNENRVGGCLIDDGIWCDLGDPASYLNALTFFANDAFPSFGLSEGKVRISPDATIHPGARVDGISSIGKGAIVGENAKVLGSVIWPGGKVAPGQRVERSVVFG